MTDSVFQDGCNWIPRAGRLWGDYTTIAEYLGLSSTAAARSWVHRHGITTRRYGRNAIAAKCDIDAKAFSGEAA